MTPIHDAWTSFCHGGNLLSAALDEFPTPNTPHPGVGASGALRSGVFFAISRRTAAAARAPID